MKYLKLFLFLVLVSVNLFAQNINTTLGTGGLFTIKDGSTTFFSLSQSTGYLLLNKSLTLPNTTNSTLGVIYKGDSSFIHDYKAPGTYGENTFIGINSGNFTMSGSFAQASQNTGVGKYSLKSLTTGYRNSAFGVNSLSFNTTGFENSAFGSYSLWSNTTGNDNSAFGYNSLYNNTMGYYNSAFGNYSLFWNTTGFENSAFGVNSLRINTTGYRNSAFGKESLTGNTTGYENSAFGYASLYLNTTGSNNSAFGNSSLFWNTTGYRNSAFGDSSLYSNTTGYSNSAFGLQALSNSTGNSNSAFGTNSLLNNTTGSNNTAIGYNAQVPNGTLSNQVRIGDGFVTYAGIQVPWTITSDRRWKSDIKNSNLGLNFISKLNPVSYFRNNDESKKTEYGLIAQEVEEVLKQEGIENTGMITVTDNGMYELRYNDLIAPMIKAIQDLKAENDELSKGLVAEKLNNEKLSSSNEKLAAEVESLKSMNEKIVKLEEMMNEMKTKNNSSLTENK